MSITTRLRRVTQRLSASATGFARERDGNIAVLTAIVVPAIAMGAAVAIDTAELHRARTNFQQALDAGTLVAAKTYFNSGGQDMAAARAAGEAAFAANLANLPASRGTLSLTFPSKEECADPDKGVVGEGDGTHPVWFSAFHGVGGGSSSGAVKISGESGVACPNDAVEIAMVLDNSGSMGGSKISTLKSASKELVETLFNSINASSNTPDPIKFSLVPFSAMVNVGPNSRSRSWMDRNGKSPIHHADLDWSWDTVRRNPRKEGDAWKNGGAHLSRFHLFDDLNVSWKGCVQMRPYPYHSNDAAPSTSNPQTLFVPAFAPDEPDMLNGLRHQKRQTVAVAPHCRNGSDGWRWKRNRSRWVCKRWTDGTKGEYHPQQGYAVNNDGVNYRNRTYIGATSTRVVNESSSIGNERYYMNDYIDDGNRMPQDNECQGLVRHRNCAGSATKQHRRQSFTFKYKDASIRDRFGRTLQSTNFGPNFMCTAEPLTPLTSSKATIDGALNRMKASGWTNVPEGVAWGWRTLSPGVPYTNGRSYEDPKNRKYLIIMTDGANTYYPIQNGFSTMNKTNYGAFGYGRHHKQGSKDGFMFKGYTSVASPSFNSNTHRQAMDHHLTQICGSVKGTGITIFSIAFDVPNGSSIKTVLEGCASTQGGKKLYYDAADNTALRSAFKDIADSIQKLRLNK